MSDAVLDIRLEQGRIRCEGAPVHEIGHDAMETGDGPVHNLRAGWRWDGRALRAWTDPTGFVPLFYAACRDRVVLSPSLAAVQRRMGRPRPDWDALAVFIRLGFFVGDDTPCAGIQVLPPGADLVWTGSDFQLTGGFQHPAPLKLDRAEARTIYAGLFAAAVRRRLWPEDRICLPLSGGRDSRHILFALAAQGHYPVQALTACEAVPPAADPNGAVAAALAARFALSHDLVPVRDGLEREREKNELTSFCAVEHAWYLSVVDGVSPQASCVFDGLAGDVLSNGHRFDPETLRLFRDGAFERIAQRMLGDAAEPAYLAPELSRELDYGRAVARLAAELRRHADAPNPVASFVFWNRTRRAVGLSPLSIMAQRAPVRLPFMDPDVRGFLMRLPAEEFGAKGFHDETIAAAYPQHCDIGYERKAEARSPTLAQRWQAVRAAGEALSALTDWPGRPAWTVKRSLVAALAGEPDRVLWWRRWTLYFSQLERSCRPG